MAYIKARPNGSFLITVSCGRDAQDHKISKSVTFRPDPCTAKGHLKSENTIQREVKEYAAAFEKKVLLGQCIEGDSLTLEKYSERYLRDYAAITQAPRTLENTRASIKQFNNDFGYMVLKNLNPLFLQEYVNRLLVSPKGNGRQGTISQNTVKRKMAVLSAMLSQAVRWNLIPSNPMERVQIKTFQRKAEERPVQCFTQEEAEIFLEVLENPLVYQYKPRQRVDRKGKIYFVEEYESSRAVQNQIKFFLYLAMFTGCRRGELIALRWPDIDFESSSVKITKSTCRTNGKMITKTTKTGATREIAVPELICKMARQWQIEQLRQQLMIGSKWEGEDFVFTQWNGRQMGLETPYHAFQRIIKNYNENRKEGELELPVIPLHGLRHTAATLLISQKVDIRTVSGRLGHANASTTLNIYSHALKELDKTASEKLGDMLLKSGS